jgi:hypothetical protein
MRSEAVLGESLSALEALGGVLVASGGCGCPEGFTAVDRLLRRFASRRTFAALIWQVRWQ